LSPQNGSLHQDTPFLGILGFVGVCVLYFPAHQDPVIASLFMDSPASPTPRDARQLGTLWISGKYAGTLSGSMNMMGNFGNALAPVITGYVLQATNNNWMMSFYIGAVVYLIGAVCWMFIDPVSPLEGSSLAEVHA
jgi:MFS family permease